MLYTEWVPEHKRKNNAIPAICLAACCIVFGVLVWVS